MREGPALLRPHFGLLAVRDGIVGDVEFAHPQWRVRRESKVHEAGIETAEARFHPAARERRGDVRPLDLLHIEGDRGYAVLDVEIEEFVGIIQRCGGQHRNDVEKNFMVAQQSHAAQHAIERATALAGSRDDGRSGNRGRRR